MSADRVVLARRRESVLRLRFIRGERVPGVEHPALHPYKLLENLQKFYAGDSDSSPAIFDLIS